MGLVSKMTGRLRAWGDRLDLMQEMFRRNGVSFSGAEQPQTQTEMRAAIAACLGCEHEGACKTWLAETPEGTPAPDFCANAFRIDRLSHKDPALG